MKQQKGSASDREAAGSKTNVIRILEQNGIEHDSYFYGNGEPASGTEVADMLGEDPDMVFKTMITKNVRLSEAPSYGKPALLYDARSTGADNYLNLAREIIKKNAQ